MKKIILCLAFLLSIVSSINATPLIGRTTSDSLSVPFFIPDSLGSPVDDATGDSLFLVVVSPGGDEVYSDSMLFTDGRISQLVWEDYGDSYVFTDVISTLVGSSTTNGVFSYLLTIHDQSLGLQFAFPGMFEVQDNPLLSEDDNVGLDWSDVLNPGSSVNLSSTNIAGVSVATAVTNKVGITDAAIDAIVDTIFARAVADTVNGSITDKVITYLVRTVGTGGGGSLDSTILSNVLKRVIYGIPVGSGSDSTTYSQRKVDVNSINGDETTADNLDNVFDGSTGTGALVTMDGLDIDAPNATTNAVDIQGPSTSGHAIYATSNNGTGNALRLTGSIGGSDGVYIGSVGGTALTIAGAYGASLSGTAGNGLTIDEMAVTGGITANITGNITGNLSGSAGSVTAEVSADVTKISGSGPAADNVESVFLGTGHTGDVDISIRSLYIDNSDSARSGDGIEVKGARDGMSLMGLGTNLYGFRSYFASYFGNSTYLNITGSSLALSGANGSSGTFSVTNSSGTAMVVKSTGSNGNGAYFGGNGDGDGAQFESGTGNNAEGIFATSAGATGRGIYALGGTVGDGMLVQGQGGQHGLSAIGQGSGDGAQFTKGSTGKDLDADFVDSVDMKLSDISGGSGTTDTTAILALATGHPGVFYGPSGSGSDPNSVMIFAIDTSAAPDDTLSGILVTADNAVGSMIYYATTDDSGKVDFNMSAGTWLFKGWLARYIFGDTSIAISSNDTIAVLGYALDPASAPASPDLCAVSGTVEDGAGNGIPFAKVTFTLPEVIVDTCRGVMVLATVRDTVTDASGNFTIDLIKSKCLKGQKYTISVDHLEYGRKSHQFSVPDAATYVITWEE